jgi:hypothetical protein
MNGMYLSFFIFTQRFMKLYKVVSKTTLELYLYCYKFLRVGLQCIGSLKISEQSKLYSDMIIHWVRQVNLYCVVRLFSITLPPQSYCTVL